MAVQIPLKILLGQDLWQDEIVAALVGLGHTVTPLPQGHDVAISYDAWRIPPGTPKDEVLTHIGTIIKQVRLTKHVQDTSEGSTPKRAPKKSRKAAGGKRGTPKGEPQPEVSVETEGQSDPGSKRERPPRRRKVADGETTDQAK